MLVTLTRSPETFLILQHHCMTHNLDNHICLEDNMSHQKYYDSTSLLWNNEQPLIYLVALQSYSIFQGLKKK